MKSCVYRLVLERKAEYTYRRDSTRDKAERVRYCNNHPVHKLEQQRQHDRLVQRDDLDQHVLRTRARRQQVLWCRRRTVILQNTLRPRRHPHRQLWRRRAVHRKREGSVKHAEHRYRRPDLPVTAHSGGVTLRGGETGVVRSGDRGERERIYVSFVVLLCFESDVAIITGNLQYDTEPMS